MKRKSKPRPKGLRLPWGATLLEVLASVVIMGLIMMVAIPRFSSQLTMVVNRGDETNIKLIQGAVRQFKLDTGIWPGTIDYLWTNPATGIPGWSGPYLEKIPASPSGKSYDINPTNGQVYLR